MSAPSSTPENSAPEDDARLVDLELRAEHQDRAVQDLDTVLLEFTRRVERIEQEVAEIRAELLKLAGMDGAAEVR